VEKVVDVFDIVRRENFSNAFGSFDIALYSSLILFRTRFAPIDGAVSLLLIRIKQCLKFLADRWSVCDLTQH